MERAPVGTIVREWGRIGLIGFGGPPVHGALLRELCVERRGWIGAREFEDANAACGLLPGPASSQLAIYCARRVGGGVGAVAGGLAFILPGLVMLIAVAALALGEDPPSWIRAVGAGAGAAVVAVVVAAGLALAGPATKEDSAAPAGNPVSPSSASQALPAGNPVSPSSASQALPTGNPVSPSSASQALPTGRRYGYIALGAAAAVSAGVGVVAVLLACGLVELALRRRPTPGRHLATLPAVAWLAFKVGALSYGGGFVIVPLMQADAVGTFGWMTGREFADAVAYGQLTPGPVTHTVAAVGYAAAGLGGALLAGALAFLPSFVIVLLAGERFDRLRESPRARAFLDGAGPAAVGAIVGAAVPLAAGIEHGWQYAVLLLAAVALGLGRPAIHVLLGGALAGLVALAAGAPV